MDSGSYGYFPDALEQAAPANQDLRLDGVMLVPWAWQITEGSVATFGWVVHLWTGERVYLEYRVDEAGRRAPENLAIRTLRDGEDRPAPSDPDAYWFEPIHVNSLLPGAEQPRHAARSRHLH